MMSVLWASPHVNDEGGRVKGDGMEGQGYGLYEREAWPNVEKGQAAMITRMDKDVGRLVSLLKALEIADNTLIVFTSDNGPHSEGGHKHEYFDANGPLRGFKRDLYEGSIRAPTIAWWPGKIKPGTVSDEPLAGYDWMATACELAGAKAPDDTDGISFLPTLLGKEQESHDYLYWSYGEKKAIRQGKWKAVIPGKGKSLELYDLDKDIGEQTDVAEGHAEVVAALTQAMEEAAR